jgi:hypothetical protein
MMMLQAVTIKDHCVNGPVGARDKITAQHVGGNMLHSPLDPALQALSAASLL